MHYATVYKRLLVIGDHRGFKDGLKLMGATRLARLIAWEEWKKFIISIEVDSTATTFWLEKEELIEHLNVLVELWTEPRDDFGDGWGGEPRTRDLKRKFEEIE